MDSIKRIDDEIYEMKQNLLNIINVKADLHNPEVIIASEKLDSILDRYNSLIRLVKEDTRELSNESSFL